MSNAIITNYSTTLKTILQFLINAMGLNDEVDPFFGNNEAKENFRAFEANPLFYIDMNFLCCLLRIIMGLIWLLSRVVEFGNEIQILI